jgi:hypothetical protein
MEEITDAMITDSNFILRQIEEDPVREDDRWPSVFKWLAYDGEGVDMTVVQLALIAGPSTWLNHIGFQEPKDFRILRVFIGAVNMTDFISDWPHGLDEDSKQRRRTKGYRRYPTISLHRQRVGRQIAGGHEVPAA